MLAARALKHLAPDLGDAVQSSRRQFVILEMSQSQELLCACFCVSCPKLPWLLPLYPSISWCAILTSGSRIELGSEQQSPTSHNMALYQRSTFAKTAAIVDYHMSRTNSPWAAPTAAVPGSASRRAMTSSIKSRTPSLPSHSMHSPPCPGKDRSLRCGCC